MKKSLRIVRHSALACAIATALNAPTLRADDDELDARWSGIWNQPDHSNQGVMLQLADDGNGGQVGVLYWFIYGDDLQPHWLMATGPVTGRSMDLTVYKASGVGFLTPSDSGSAAVDPIGIASIEFEDCDDGVMVFDTDDEMIGSGEIRLERLVTVSGLSCDDDDDSDDDDWYGDDDDSDDDDWDDDDDSEDDDDDDSGDDEDEDSEDDDDSEDDEDEDSEDDDDDDSEDDDDDDSEDDEDEDSEDDDSADEDGSDDDEDSDDEEDDSDEDDDDDSDDDEDEDSDG